MNISVVIPVYKQGQYLAECIESVLNQTLQPHEIIVVDDGSPDNSAEVAARYPVKLVRQANKGLSSARNTGLMNMTGDYFYPLDSDDAMLPNCLERITQVIEETGADIVSPSFRCFGLHDTPVILMPNPTLEDFKTGNRVGYFSAIKKEALLEIGGYSPKMVFGYEDLALWINLLSRGKKIVTIPEVLVLYRTKENSMIHDAQSHHKELVDQINKDFPNSINF